MRRMTIANASVLPILRPARRIIGLVGWSGAGKTTLIEKLIIALKARDLSVSTVKHAHHAFDMDRPGKDSFRHREAGAKEVLVVSDTRWALMHELREGAEPSLRLLLRKLDPVDLVLIEGFKTILIPKIEVHRAANGKPYLFPGDPHIVALASDTACNASIPIIALDDVEALADAIIDHALDLEAFFGREHVLP